MKIVINASEGILGRIAGFAAKQVLLGKEITVVNCNDVLITGDKVTTLEKYKRAVRRGGSSLKGPKIIRSPEGIMKRTIRGMLPHKKGRGAAAFKLIRCYNKMPKEYENMGELSMKRELKGKAISLKELCKNL